MKEGGSINISELAGLIKSSAGAVIAISALLGALVEISPVKLNPWSRIAKWVGGAINRDVLSEIKALRGQEDETLNKLNTHIALDDERDADLHRYRILGFNTELMRGIKHTEEDFNEVFYSINAYTRYCRDNPDYENNRAVRAIANINRVYDKCSVERDFL